MPLIWNCIQLDQAHLVLCLLSVILFGWSSCSVTIKNKNIFFWINSVPLFWWCSTSSGILLDEQCCGHLIVDSSPVVKNQAIQRGQNFQKLAQFTVWFLEAVCSVDVHAVKDFLYPSWVTICSSFWQFPKHGLIIVLLICHTNYNKKWIVLIYDLQKCFYVLLMVLAFKKYLTWNPIW